jgi:serine/threonine-protein kinase PRP4
MVFDRFDMDLRQVLKTFGRKVGININPVRVYGAQLLTSLCQLRKLRIVHADIKPDNVLVTEDKRKVVLADFGSAADAEDCEITPYLVSRYYRAPEVSLGHPYGCEIDVWAVGCTLYEMCKYTRNLRCL